jgi:uncharacterized protein YqfA (UPF0365 family)
MFLRKNISKIIIIIIIVIIIIIITIIPSNYWISQLACSAKLWYQSIH